MRRDHRPVWLRTAFDRLETRWVNHFLRPQFDQLGRHAVITRPWNLHLYGPGITAGNHLHLYNATGIHTRLTTWKGQQANPRLTIGNHVLISPGFLANAANEISIGNDCMIASQVYISDSDWHGLYDRASEPASTAPVILEDNVWIGFRSIVCKGVRIGRNSVIGAGSVVVNSVPDNAIAAGNPARVIRQLDMDRPMRTRADIFKDPDAHETWTRNLMEVELEGNTSLSWLRARLAPRRSD